MLFILLAFCENLFSQKDSTLVRIIQDIDSSKTKIGDTIQIQFQNISNKQLAYNFEIVIFRDSNWFENPFYTRYYNHKLSYKKLEEMFSHHLPVIPSKNWRDDYKDLKPNEIDKLAFIVIKKVKDSIPVKVRIKFYGEDGIVGESTVDMIDSSPFPFVLIQE